MTTEIGVIRRITAADRERVEAAAYAFASRHEIDISRATSAWPATDAVVTHVSTTRGRGSLRESWRKVFRRAIGSRLATGFHDAHVVVTR